MPWYWPFDKDSQSTGTYSINNSYLIEGISDDTILLFAFILSLLGLLAYYANRERNTNIHPDNRQDVEILRERAQQATQADATNETPTTRAGRPRHDTCPICLTDSSVLSIETNCGHLFCGKCIITFWKFQSNWMSGMSCPVCRQPVTVLLTCFTADEEALEDNSDRQTVVNDVRDFNRRFSGAPRSFREYIADIPVLIPHIIRQIFSLQSLAWAYRIRMMFILVTVIVYVLSPFDIFPENMFGFLGLFDDVFIILCAAMYIIIAYREYISRS
ncbi:unnamed protein product [Adineta ricciae]|uniref:E3 ubiquitin-protein ligase RNF170 n=1 Tax=Adineta ricciae TaxID=249248 RepID=A0A814PT20_ADIRI|nr:unnamed protein product [Adineta ricciae]CAF1110490.1 unnamed protein product [Adineta ricciae]